MFWIRERRRKQSFAQLVAKYGTNHWEESLQPPFQFRLVTILGFNILKSKMFGAENIFISNWHFKKYCYNKPEIYKRYEKWQWHKRKEKYFLYIFVISSYLYRLSKTGVSNNFYVITQKYQGQHSVLFYESYCAGFYSALIWSIYLSTSTLLFFWKNEQETLSIITDPPVKISRLIASSKLNESNKKSIYWCNE